LRIGTSIRASQSAKNAALSEPSNPNRNRRDHFAIAGN
jgi:hypothetical protein